MPFSPAAFYKMIRKLPEDYLNRMKASLSEDYEAFLACYERPAEKALRFHPGRVRNETREKLIREWKLEKVPWCPDGYYYSEETVRPGLSPYHDAGVFYIQEPSAMITASSADIRPTDLVLDLCAAPGGKSTQAGAAAGLLISNEPVLSRARILSSNIERMGFSNTVVTSAWPDELSKVFPEAFDRIIVDAPCSGEGMMRKDETAIEEWSETNVLLCVERQREILAAASRMLKPGGKLIYSTCTFEHDENEGQIEAFLKLHPEYSLEDMHMLYPHKIRGEGHFCAVLHKEGVCTPGSFLIPEAGKHKKNRKSSETSANGLPLPGSMGAFLKTKKIHVLRAGLEKGETKEDRKGNSYYTPSHAEAMAKSFDSDPGPKLNITDMDLCLKYLKGETLSLSEDQGADLNEDGLERSGCGYELNGGEGWLTVYYDRYPLGLGKRIGNTIKNHYPKGLRRLS